MKAPREISLQTGGVAAAKKLGYLVKKLGDDSWPDYIMVNSDGRTFFVEFKRKGEKLEPGQFEVASQLLLHGACVVVFDSLRTFKIWLGDNVGSYVPHYTYYSLPSYCDPRNPKWRPTIPELKSSPKSSAPSARSRGLSASRRQSSDAASKSRTR